MLCDKLFCIKVFDNPFMNLVVAVEFCISSSVDPSLEFHII